MHVEFYRHGLEPAAAAAVAQVIATPILTSGAVGRRVEQQLAEYFGTAHAALVNSWTNGALATLLALGIGPGDEVIVPAMTFIATANIVELVGARPVFADVDPETLLLTPEAVGRVTTARTKAVIPVHLYGQMIDIPALKAALNDRSDIAIIEDCAHCFEGERDGHKPGTHSDAAVFSFYATKNVTCGEGGAIVTNNTGLYQTLLQTRLHGMSATAFDRFKGNGYRHWDMERLGVKANLPDLLAALLPTEIAAVDDRLKKREAIVHRYETALEDTPIRLLRRIGNTKHAHHIFAIHVPPAVRDDVLQILGERHIGCTVNFRSVPTLTFFRKKYGYERNSFPISYDWGAGTISLPLYPSLREDELAYVTDVLHADIVPVVEKALIRS